MSGALALMMGGGGGGGPLAIDSITSFSGTAAPTLTFSHTCIGANRGLIVNVGYQSVATITGITFNLVPMSFASGITNVGLSMSVAQWSLSNPSLGTHDVVVTFSATVTTIVAGAVSFVNANQVTASLTGAGASNQGNNNSVSISIGAPTTEIIVDVIKTDTTPVIGPSPQASSWVTPGNASSTKPGNGGLTTLSWTLFGGGSDYAYAGITVKPT